ncbi:hypothetical protein AB656_01490 [Bifidobacterium actinocoloniiforme DSM 22766]|nr:hypothetical protein AB656_01490 [Bifidobacterium actinocoloniiforme DSM 22766]
MGRVVTSALTALIIIALALALLLLRPPSALSDQGRVADIGSRQVSQLNLTDYCPARMSLADTTGFGEAKPDEGNIASASRYAAFGPVYASYARTVGSDDELKLNDADPSDDDQVQTASSPAGEGGSIQSTRLLKAVQGAGAASSMVSWATSGDLRGVQAASCLPTGFERSFLLPASQKGWSQQLVVYNPSTKAASVNLEAYGTSARGPLALNTRGVVTVKAGGDSVYDLAAAAPGQDALFVRLTGTDAPVAATVRLSAMSGTDALGSDFATDIGQESRQAVLPGVEGGDQPQLLLMSQGKAHIKASWVLSTGSTQAKEADLPGGRVAAIDMGQAPEGAVGLSLDADAPVLSAAKLTRQGQDGQSDFAMLAPASARKVSAIALPDQAVGSLALVNVSGRESSATLVGLDGAGKRTGSRSLNLNPGQGTIVSMADLGHGTALARLEDSNATLAWSARVGVDAVSQAGVTGLAVVGAQALEPQTLRVRAQQDRTLVR